VGTHIAEEEFINIMVYQLMEIRSGVMCLPVFLYYKKPAYLRVFIMMASYQKKLKQRPK